MTDERATGLGEIGHVPGGRVPHLNRAWSLHAVVGGPAAALRADPVDVLRVVLDITRLAVDAVLRVDYQLRSLLAILPGHVLVDACWAEPSLWPVVLCVVDVHGEVVVVEREVRRLVAL